MLEATRFSLAPGVNDILVVNSIIHTNTGFGKHYARCFCLVRVSSSKAAPALDLEEAGYYILSASDGILLLDTVPNLVCARATKNSKLEFRGVERFICENSNASENTETFFPRLGSIVVSSCNDPFSLLRSSLATFREL